MAKDFGEALDTLDQAVLKLHMFTGLLTHIPPDRELALGRAATDGLYFFLDGLGDDIGEASEVINQAYRNGGKR